MRSIRSPVLDANTVRTLAAVMALGTVGGIVMFARHGPARRPREFRAEDNPPEVLQVVWPLLVIVPQLYPFLVAVVPDLAYAGLPRFGFPGDDVAQIAGFLLWGLGGLLVLWAGRALGRFMMLQIAVATDHRLIDTGPYAFVRHPTYTGTMCLAVGVSLLFLSPILVGLAVAVVLVANYRARKEERLLGSPAGLGEAYGAYMARTGRFLPRPR